MKLNITKSENGTYTLELQSGHFLGKLESISEESLDSLSSALKSAKSTDSGTIVWNPRSQRHERM